MSKVVGRITDAEYFGYEAISKSQLKKWDERNPMKFWQKCVLNPNRISEPITDALVQGKLAHLLLLEPQKFAETFTVIPDGKGLSSRTTKTFAEIIEKNKETGKEVILESEYRKWKKNIDTLKSYELVQAILKGILIEKPIIWEQNGMKLKCKLDAVKNTPQGIVLIEYKTTSQIERVTKGLDFSNYGYDVGMQSMAIEALYGKKPVKMVFIIQSNRDAEENCIDVRSVEQDDIETFKNFTEITLKRIKKRLDGGLIDKSFRTELKECAFDGYNDSVFSFDFYRQTATLIND